MHGKFTRILSTALGVASAWLASAASAHPGHSHGPLSHPAGLAPELGMAALALLALVGIAAAWRRLARSPS